MTGLRELLVLRGFFDFQKFFQLKVRKTPLVGEYESEGLLTKNYERRKHMDKTRDKTVLPVGFIYSSGKRTLDTV